MENQKSVVGFIDLLGTKSSANANSEHFETMLFSFYSHLINELQIESSAQCRTNIFGDCAYFYIENFNDEYAERLAKLRAKLFIEGHFFKCAIVSGTFTELDIVKVHNSLPKDRDDKQFLVRVVSQLFERRLERKSERVKEQFWNNISLSYFGASSTKAYFEHEDFKGMGFSLSKETVGELGGYSPDKKGLFVESYFPSAISNGGYKRFFDIRYPRDVCITIYLFKDRKVNIVNTDEKSEITDYHNQYEEIIENLYSKMPDRIKATKIVLQRDSFDFVKRVIDSMYLSSLRKREYAQFYCSALNSIIVTSNFSLIHYSGPVEGLSYDESWELFPEVFYEIVLKRGVLEKMLHIDSFDLVLIVLMKTLSSEMLRRIYYAKQISDETIIENSRLTIMALLYKIDRVVNEINKNPNRLSNYVNLSELINNKYNGILTNSERTILIDSLFEVSKPFSTIASKF